MKATITKRDTAILKGFAILCIVLHNYFHWLAPSPGENEFDFSSSRVSEFFRLLGDQPSEWFNLLFSYLGHYGVQIFIFISGFGLAVSMLNKPRSWESFVLVRLKKLYPLLLVGVLAYFLSCILLESKYPGNYIMQEMKYKLLFIHTLIPNSGMSVNGPWWFFGLIFQLYLLFPLLFRWIRKQGAKAFFSICVLSYGMMYLFHYYFNLYHGTLLMMNAPGHLPEFCLGILLACNKDIVLGWRSLFLGIVCFCLGNVKEALYPFTFLAVVVLVLFAYQGLKRIPVKKQWLSRPLAYFGGISMTLFAVHGFFRTPVLKLAQTMQGAWGHVFTGLYYFLIVWAVAVAAKVLYDFVVRQLDRIHIRESRATKIIGWIFGVALGLFFAFVLGYYVKQNLQKSGSPVEVQVTPTWTVKKDLEYMSLITPVVPDGKWSSVDIHCSFDFSSQDPSAPLPWIILDITDHLWLKFELPATYNTPTPQHYELSYRYLCPFVKNLKGKQVKLYFWNINKAGSFKFENTKVTMVH